MAMDFGGMGGGGLAEAGGALGGAVGAWLGNKGAENNRRNIEGELAAIRAMYDEMRPEVRAQMEQEFSLGPSAMEGVASEIDPAMRSTRLAALRSLMDSAQSGGMDAQSRAGLMQAQAGAAREQRATQGALRNDFAARGRGGGGTELALRAAAQQQAANANAMAGVQAAGDARARALASLQAGAGLAGDIGRTDYAQATDRAGARDRVAEYNARNAQAVRGRNIDRDFASQQGTFNNRMARQAGRDRASYRGIEYDEAEAGRKLGQGAAMGSAVGRTAGAAIGALGGF